jgi:hypothetical protein
MTGNKRFLRVKHWQLFLLTFGPLIVFKLFVMALVFLNPGVNSNFNHAFMATALQLVLAVLIFFLFGVFFGWFWAVAIGLQHVLADNVKMKTTVFKIFFLIAFGYILFLALAGATARIFANSGSYDGLSGELLDLLIGAIGLLFFVAIFGIFYIIYFAAKTFKTVQLQRETTFSDFVGEFFMICFYPIGIWFLQPKINEAIEHKDDADWGQAEMH